jgi:hypothetical protein
MARVRENIVTTGLSGKIGNLVFRTRGKKTSVYIMSPRKSPPSEKQKLAQQQFSEAVAQARHSLSTTGERLRFEEMARREGKESAYSAAVSYYYRQIRGKIEG